MKTMFFMLASVAAFGLAGCVQTTAIPLQLKTTSGKKIGDCGNIYIHRQTGVVMPGTVLINKAMVTSPVPLHKLSPKDRQLVIGCNSGLQTIYAGHAQPIVGIGIGVTRLSGGGDSNIYGSTAVSGSQSGANAGAIAGSGAN